MSGRWAYGEPFIDPATGQITKFINAGDPVTRQGWLDERPGDRRFLVSSGPFTLAVGDTQEVVGAKIIAPGSNPSSAVTALRFYDAFAQTAYDRKFEVINAPAPKVEVRRLDQEVVLTWLEGHDVLESFEQAGYQFQGYCVYQGASLNGPFTPIAVFDVIDGIQDIVDRQLDETSGRILDKLIIAANDAGVQRYISIKTDTTFNVGQPLSNYRDYYFAVTSYFVDLDALPKVVESPLVPIRVSPSAPDYGVSIEAKTGARVNLTHDKGSGDGEFFYKIVDPTLIPNATYRVTWNDDSMPWEGAYTWNLERNGERILVNQRIAGRDVEGKPNDDAPVVDGLQIQILPKTFTAPALVLYTKVINDLNRSLRLWNDGARLGFSDLYNELGNNVPTPPVEVLQLDLEFRFTGKTAGGDDNNDAPIVVGGQWSTQWERLSFGQPDLSSFARVQVRAPFELWEVENNRQVNFALINRNADAASLYGNGVGDPNTPGMEPRYRMTGRDYIIPIMTPYDPATATTTVFAHNDPNTTWLLFFRQRGESVWNTGDVLRIEFPNPTIPGKDEYTFTTTAAVVSGQTALAKSQLQRINVVPNPYWAHNPMERDSHNRLVRITNLPSQGAKIRIFNLAGDLVRVIDDADRRTDGTNGLQHVNWDLRNDAGNSVGSGVYLIHVEVPGVGVVVKKAAIIMRQERLEIF